MVYSSYIKWHYGIAIKEGILIWKNVTQMSIHYFSNLLLPKTFVDSFVCSKNKPRKRLSEVAFFAEFFRNASRRILGDVFRFLIMGLAIFTLAFLTMFAGFLIFVWALLPAIIIVLFLMGVSILI